MLHHLKALILAGLLFAPVCARAVEHVRGHPCLSTLRKALVEDGHEAYEFDKRLYQDSHSILFLADGISFQDEPGVVVLGEAVARAFPDKRVVSADFEYYGPPGHGNYRKISLDNERKFPFDDNTFDTVVLRRGLCVCFEFRCCGGFLPQSVEARSFFKEVVRVLDKKGTHARAILHGGYNESRADLHAWSWMLHSIENEFGVTARFHYDRYGFVMIEIMPKGGGKK